MEVAKTVHEVDVGTSIFGVLITADARTIAGDLPQAQHQQTFQSTNEPLEEVVITTRMRTEPRISTRAAVDAFNLTSRS